VIYEHGEPWWNDDTDRGELLIRPPELSGNRTIKTSDSKQDEREKEMMNLSCEVFFSYIQMIFMCRKILRHRASGYVFSPKEGLLRIFIVLKHPWPRLGLNPQTLVPRASTLTITPLTRQHMTTNQGNFNI
jgi:hypothetical protein